MDWESEIYLLCRKVFRAVAVPCINTHSPPVTQQPPVTNSVT